MKLFNQQISITFIFILIIVYSIYPQQSTLTYKIVDTGQKVFYNNTSEISEPSSSDSFYGQDAQFSGNQPSYTDNGDGTVTDNNTGLMWQQNLSDQKFTYQETLDGAASFNLAEYNDWRLPTIKELYSLMMFYGKTGNSEANSIPFIDTDYFDFRFGGTVESGERFIDAQWATSSAYIDKIMNGQDGMFGLNLVDGRIKCYPQHKLFEVFYVRGNTDYGKNDFVDNNDKTITDNATGLMWDQIGSSEGMNWEDALEYVKTKNVENYLGYNDWRMPNAKELHSIVDYSRSPGVTNSAAIDPLFNVPTITDEGGNEDYPFYWTCTTHNDGPSPSKAVYISFGRALGFMSFPPNFDVELMDVHGAGAQRSDPKDGDPDDYPEGHGPQGDVIRIFNYVRLVRDADISTDIKIGDNSQIPNKFVLEQNYPNPFNPSTNINFSIPDVETRHGVSLVVYNLLGEKITTLVNEQKSPGNYTVEFSANNLPSGVYFYRLTADNTIITKKMLLLR